MPDGDAARAVYARAVPRYLTLLEALGVPCTFFVIGRDLDVPAAFAGLSSSVMIRRRCPGRLRGGRCSSIPSAKVVRPAASPCFIKNDASVAASVAA